MPVVLIQAGHEGGVRNSGTSGTAPTSGTNGLGDGNTERSLTPLVADAAVATLAAFPEFTVIRENAFYDKVYECDLALSLHFDGSGTPCATGASIGYPTGSPPGSNKQTADLWRSIYTPIWPFGWMADNFTGNLSGFYGYSWTVTTVAEMLIEFGELTCPEENAWLVPRAQNGYLGRLVAYFVGRVFNVDVPHPDDEEDPMATAPRIPVIGDVGDDVWQISYRLQKLGYGTASSTWTQAVEDAYRVFLDAEGYTTLAARYEGTARVLLDNRHDERLFKAWGGSSGWQETRVAAIEANVADLEGHTHDEGQTGPPQ